MNVTATRRFAAVPVRLLPVFVGLLAAASLLALGCAEPESTVAAEPVAVAAAASPAQAVSTFIEADGGAFAGPCEETVSPRDIGKVCARFVEERDGVRAYLIGRTFSEFSTWVFVRQGSAGWSLAGSAPLDFHDMTMTIPWPR